MNLSNEKGSEPESEDAKVKGSHSVHRIRALKAKSLKKKENLEAKPSASESNLELKHSPKKVDATDLIDEKSSELSILSEIAANMVKGGKRV